MGIAIERDHFDATDRQRFRQRLDDQLDYLRQLLQQPVLSQGPCSLGAELEMSLVDSQLEPFPANQQLIAAVGCPQLCEEINQVNLEYNLAPVMALGSPFAAMEQELRPFLSQLQGHADRIGASLVPIGILPTLAPQHLQQSYMTDAIRYRVLSEQLLALRGGEPFQININGEQPLRCQWHDITIEGANTSLQLHLRTPADSFARWYNAAQLTAPLVLAVAGNSPLLLGHKLWQETRIALFKQSVDPRRRSRDQGSRGQCLSPPRVSFGTGWLRDGAWELFAENVALHPPLFPVVDEKLPLEACQELNLHHGSVWPWSRAVLDTGHDPHLRIELRALPSGPTVTDMMANAALAIGWTVALAEVIDSLLPRLPFKYATYNFYRAAELGLEAELLWPAMAGIIAGGGTGSGGRTPVRELIGQLLPLAADGLLQLGVDAAEVSRLLAVIEQRLASGQTGARWQLQTLAHYEQRFHRERAIKAMLAAYIDQMWQGKPVACWQ